MTTPEHTETKARDTSHLHRWSSILFTLGITLFIFSLLRGNSYLWDKELLILIPGYLTRGISVVCVLGAFILSYRTRKLPLLDTLTLSTAAPLIFLTDWLCRDYSLFPGPAIRGELLLGAIVGYLLLRKGQGRAFHYLPIAASALCIVCFLVETQGRLLYTDDHSTFFYRLSLLKNNFPRIPFYNPLWNGGIDARDFFASGSLNIFLIFSPVIYLFNLATSYNLIIATLLFVLVPLSLYLAARIEGISRLGGSLAATVGLSTSLLWYRWALKYGTLGFLTATMLLPLNLALARRLITAESVTWRGTVPFIVSFSLMLFWTPSGLVFLPIIGLTLLSARRLIKNKALLATAVALVLLNLPWITLFWSVSKVSSFVQAEKAPASITVHEEGAEVEAAPVTKARHFRHRGGSPDLRKSLHILRDSAVTIHPLILFFGLPGICLLGRRSKLFFALTSAWLLFLGTVMVPIKPQLELDRMLLILAMVLSLPTGAVLDVLVTEGEKSSSPRTALIAMALSFLLVGPLITGSILRNRSVEQYRVTSSEVTEIEEAILSHGGAGRVLFSGCVVHELNEGHLAPLVLRTNHPLMASSFVHNLWHYTQIFPYEYIERQEAGIEEYLDLYNVTAVFAHEPEWRRYFSERSDSYQEVWRGEKFILYRRKSTPTYLLHGEGEVKQSENKVIVVPKSDRVVLKFNYLPFLRASGCRIAPHTLSESVTFIELTHCPINTSVEIEADIPWKRIGS